jgi:hypothetical protein
MYKMKFKTEITVMVVFVLLLVIIIHLCRNHCHRLMAWGGHKLPKVSAGPAMPDLSMPCGVAHPQGKRPAAVFFPMGRLTPHPLRP